MEAEKKTAEMLLKKGVKVQLTAPFFLKLFRKKTLNFMLRMPTLYTLLRIAHEYVCIKQDVSKIVCTKEAMQLLRTDGRRVSKIVALALLNNAWMSWLKTPLARLLEKSLTGEEMLNLYQLITLHGGLDDFLNTIRLIQETRITKPMNLSPNERES